MADAQFSVDPKSINLSSSAQAALVRAQPLFELFSENFLGPLRNRACELHEFASLKMRHEAVPSAVGCVVEQHQVVSDFLNIGPLLHSLCVVIGDASEGGEAATVVHPNQNASHVQVRIFGGSV